jgi:hypothetical protein
MDLRENGFSASHPHSTFHERQFYLTEEFEVQPFILRLNCAVTRSSWDDLVGGLEILHDGGETEFVTCTGQTS